MYKKGISILISSRIKNNENHNLINLLNDIEYNTKYKKDIEVLVKYDTDDDIDSVNSEINTFKKYSFRIQHIITPKSRGYIDLHVFYNQLFLISNPNFNHIMAMADDFGIAVNNWDEIVYETSKDCDDLFILHNWMPNLELPFNMVCSEHHHVDEGPIWSRKLVELWGGLGQISFTDGWTIGVEWFLYNKYSMNITRYLGQYLVTRTLCNNDGPSSPRWYGDRKYNMDLFDNENFKNIIRMAALNIKNYEN